MTKYSFDIKKRFNAAFQDAKYITSGFTGDLLTKTNEKSNPYSNSEALRIRTLGTPVFDQIDVESVGSGLTYSFKYDPLVDINYTKVITETKTSSGRAVVEYAGISPANISIRGVLWGQDGVYPSKELEELLALFREESVLNVSSKLFSLHQITSIYIKSLATPSLEGFEDTQPFTIQARGIESVSLTITENELQ
ncbi:DUF6046 domain-containing protein [uncultured Microscilla sp.]|uniref:DUF6046 domain-containing protein n=1 Tax=uncultured Microscilla sp. TaxID=432653 RepID=UPI00260BCF4D|nr:DUF6046 domain-containing protein [uncultured Microscilla sp.]